MWGIAVNRRLLPLIVARIDEIMSKRHLKIWDVMAEMGFARLNASLGMALAGDKVTAICHQCIREMARHQF